MEQSTKLQLSLCTNVVLFFFSKISASEASAREPLSPSLAVNEPLRFIFYHPRSTDFEEKIENKGSVNTLTLTIVKHFLVHYSSSRLCISSTVTLQRIYINRPAFDIFPFLGQKALLV